MAENILSRSEDCAQLCSAVRNIRRNMRWQARGLRKQREHGSRLDGMRRNRLWLLRGIASLGWLALLKRRQWGLSGGFERLDLGMIRCDSGGVILWLLGLWRLCCAL